MYPREIAKPGLIIVRVDSFMEGQGVYLTGWLYASEAGVWPIDPGRHLTRHAVLPEALHGPDTLPLPDRSLT